MDIKQLNEMDGRRISGIYFPNEDNTHQRFDAEGVCARLSHENYGDHGENWIVVMHGGQEVERINARFVESIRWAKEEA